MLLCEIAHFCLGCGAVHWDLLHAVHRADAVEASQDLEP